MNGVYQRWDLLNYLVQKFGYKKYLEIGVQSGICFNYVKCDYKVGVDPNENHVKFKMTSDEFFRQNEETFDLVFIDGLHESPQVFKDIINSLEVLTPNGTIVCHDMLPATKEAQQVPRIQAIWNGDCYRAFVQLRASRPDLAMCTVNADHGLGVIMRGEQELIDIEGMEIDWSTFSRNQELWMNKMPYQDFYQLCDQIEKLRNEEVL